ncbi:MAG: tetratricopeptide repeat protein [Bryobacteraceae bacterium]|nr:tetratricopeptide repeat protein [Bryobacteraceae bacterium]MDW8378141.1 tetratricopeptide repeat protein [Bryobacterales bacterium]
MARSFFVFLVAELVFGGPGKVVWGKAQEPKATQQAPAQPELVEPPEEDESHKAKEYEFNPLQAAQELKVGQFYFKKGSFKAAARRFEEATRWDPTSAEAFLRLGEALEKLKEEAAARKAYAKYLELAPQAKNAAAIRKRLGLK